MIHGDGELTMAQVCGEQPYGPLVFYPGEDFDPSDPEDCEAVRLASENDAHDRMRELEQENARLRAALSERAAFTPPTDYTGAYWEAPSVRD